MKLYKGSSRLPVLLLVLGIVIIIAGGYVFLNPNTLETPVAPSETSEEKGSTATPTPTAGNKSTPVSPSAPLVKDSSIKATSVLKLEVGELSGNMTLTTINPFRGVTLATNNVVAEFSGSATVTGTYNYYFSEFDGEWTLSFTLSDDEQLPQVDERSPAFFFKNQKEAEELLKIRNGFPEKGTATIEVRNYTLKNYPSEVMDTTTISSVE